MTTARKLPSLCKNSREFTAVLHGSLHSDKQCTSYSFKASTRIFVPVPRIYFSIKSTYLTLLFPRICSPASGLFAPNINCHFAFQETLSYLLFIYLFIVGQDSSVGITPLYVLDCPGVESRCAAKFSVPVQTGPGATEPPIEWEPSFFAGG